MKKIILLVLIFLIKIDADIYANFDKLGEDAYIKGYYSLALKYHKKLLDIRKNSLGKEHLETANSYYYLGRVYCAMGDYVKALKYHKKSLNIREKKLNQGHLDISTSYFGIGEVYHSTGNYLTALKYYKKALVIHEKILGEDNFHTSIINNNIGVVYKSMGYYKQALDYGKKALIIQKKILDKEHPEIATSFNNIGLIYDLIGDYPKALEYYTQSLTISKKSLGEKHPLTSKLYNNIGLVYFKKKNYKKALNYYKKSLFIKEKILGKEHFNTINSYLNISGMYEIKKDYKNAYKYAKQAFNAFKENKDRNFLILDSRQKKIHLESNKKIVINLFQTNKYYANNLKNMDKKSKLIQNIFNKWLNYKRTIYDIENSFNLLYKRGNKKIKSQINQLYNAQRKLARLYQNPIQNNKLIENLKNKISNLEIELGKKSMDIHTSNITYKNILNLLNPHELYIDFAKIDKNYYLFTLDKSQNITFQKLEKPKEIEDYIVRIREDLGDIPTNITKKRYAKLYNLIFKNIDIKDKTSLIISPDGLLGLIPFEAFYIEKEQKYLIEKLNIRYIPSGKELVKLYQNRTTPKEDIVVFANPNFGLKTASSKERKGTIEALYSQAKSFNRVNNFFGSLAGSVDEADKIRFLFGDTEIYMGDKANEENFFKLNSPKILHLSTHGFFIKDKDILNPMLKTGIALSGANYAIANKTGDGIVTGLELSGLNLNGTELVVLSACETGVGEVEEAEGVAGLSKAFMRAGAKSVIMTLWSVDDKASATLMERFYEGIKKGLGYSDALREAKLSMIRKNLHPFYWSGFVGSGED